MDNTLTTDSPALFVTSATHTSYKKTNSHVSRKVRASFASVTLLATHRTQVRSKLQFLFFNTVID
jgi:hypothetical protein